MSLIRIASLLALCCSGATAMAEPFHLLPAEAGYRVLVSGIPTGIQANIRLERDPARADRFQLSFLVEHPVIHHVETSGFLWRDCHASPQGYQYASRGFGIRRGGEVGFDWTANQAISSHGSFSIPADAVDALGLAMMARCQLKAGASELHFQVAEPAGLEAFEYRVLGREQLETPAGTFSTIKIERLYPERGRRTILWAAEELEYFMIRMDHIENPLVRGRMELTRFRHLDERVALGAQDTGSSND